MNYDNYYMPYMNVPETNYSKNNTEDMYPDIYKFMYPHVKNVVREMKTQSYTNFMITDEILDSMCNEVINRSGLYTDMNDNYNDDMAVETVSRMGGRQYRRHEDHRINPGRFRRDNSILRDIARILLLRELFGRI